MGQWDNSLSGVTTTWSCPIVVGLEVQHMVTPDDTKGAKGMTFKISKE